MICGDLRDDLAVASVTNCAGLAIAGPTCVATLMEPQRERLEYKRLEFVE